MPREKRYAVSWTTLVPLAGLPGAVVTWGRELPVVPGRATRLQGGLHLVLVVVFVFLAANP